MRFGTVTDVQPGICTVKVAGGEIPVIYLKGSTPTKGEFVAVHRQGVVSYLLNPPTLGALWAGDSNLNGIWRVPTSGQNPVFYATPGIPIHAVVEGPDKNIWACGNGSTASYVLRMTSSGSQIGQFASVALASSGDGSPYLDGICVGPDGNLWVADANGFVWKITPELVASGPYSLPTSAPYGISAGPDGNLWATDNNNNALWKITTAGVPTEVKLVPSGSPSGGSVQYVCVGSDGDLWASDYDGGIWRCTTSGQSVWAAVTQSFAAPEGICAGPDHRIWMADDALGGVWAFTTDLTIQFYATNPSASLNPYAICAGPDGRLWTGVPSGGFLVAFTTKGTPVTYPLSATAQPYSICSGP